MTEDEREFGDFVTFATHKVPLRGEVRKAMDAAHLAEFGWRRLRPQEVRDLERKGLILGRRRRAT